MQEFVKFRDVSHLYINSYVEFTDSNAKKIIKLTDFANLNSGFINDYYYYSGLIKPLLRPLSDVTIAEAHEIIKFCSSTSVKFENLCLGYYGYGYKNNVDEIHETVLCFEFNLYSPIFNRNTPLYLLQIDTEDRMNPVILGEFTNEGYIKDGLIDYPFDLTLYLINQGFDLFNLIQNGQALNIKK